MTALSEISTDELKTIVTQNGEIDFWNEMLKVAVFETIEKSQFWIKQQKSKFSTIFILLAGRSG